MQNYGKKFEQVIRQSFEKVDGVSIDRLTDNTAGFKGIAGICDFIVYRKPCEYYIECKSVHGNTLSINSNDLKKKYGNISNAQWEGMLEKSKINGVYAGVICWWTEKGVTRYIPIQCLDQLKKDGAKSIRYDDNYGVAIKDKGVYKIIDIPSNKRRVFFDYQMEELLDIIEGKYTILKTF